ncbi:uncharacterized protein LOC129256736 [Lytechinus pictus]|uniref:uncharacterized protein LOC129256736 n=1 Tax=Lytechinus pictus TaxID=7653 RepID=UPI0030BA0234
MANSAGYKLRTAAHKHLTDSECTTLKICIRRFRETQSVLGLCTSLQRFLDTPDKVHLMTLIFPMIPKDLLVDFDNLSRLQFEYYSTLVRPKLVEKYKLDGAKVTSPNKGLSRKSSSRVLLPVEQLHNLAEAREHTMETFKGRRSEVHRNGSQRAVELTRVAKEHKRSKTYHAPEQPVSGDEASRSAFREPQPPVLNTSQRSSDSTPRVRLGELKQEATPKSLQVRRVTLERRDGQSFGFCIRGGIDLNTGIFVSEVDAGGQAERKGMKVGERILKVNNVVFKSISHSQAVVAIKSAPRIHVYLAPLGQMPGSTGTTPRIDDNIFGSLGCQLRLPSTDTINTESSKSRVRKVTILAEEDGWLGFSIRGGTDQNMDITVANVDISSPADRAGLKKGERILKVNGTPVEGLEHMHIVNLVLSASIVVLHVKPAPRRSSQSSAVSSKMRGRHVSSSSSTASKGAKQDFASGNEFDESLTQSSVRRGLRSPIPETAQEIAQFVAEMQSTPPVSTSTPLPPDDDPRLIKNRNQYLREMYNSAATDEDSILQGMRDEGGGGDLDAPLHLNLSNLSGRTLEESSHQNARGMYLVHGNEDFESTSPRRGSKFDQGTIRLNLAKGSMKDTMKEAKLINIDIDFENDVDKKQRKHVKDLFEQKQETNRKLSPSPNRQGSHCKQIPDGYTPRMNILSSPYTHFDRENNIKAESLTPSSQELKGAIKTASSQISNELTGKSKGMTTCNVPPSPHNESSPVSKFINKVLRRRSSGGKDLLKKSGTSPSNSIGRTDSLHGTCRSLRLDNIIPEPTIQGSAYDSMKMRGGDFSSTDGD